MQRFILGLWHALDGAAEAFGGEFVSEFFAFDQNEAPLSPVGSIQSESRVRCCYRSTKCIKNDGIMIAQIIQDAMHELQRFGKSEDSPSHDFVHFACA